MFFGEKSALFITFDGSSDGRVDTQKSQFQTVVSDGTCVTTYAADPCETECAPEPALLRPE